MWKHRRSPTLRNSEVDEDRNACEDAKQTRQAVETRWETDRKLDARPERYRRGISRQEEDRFSQHSNRQRYQEWYEHGT